MAAESKVLNINYKDIMGGRLHWFTKIELIYKIHRSTSYDEDRTVQMVNSLGNPYDELNSYHKSGNTPLYNNPQNNELVDYLISHAKYISRKIDKGSDIKVTYHRNPDE